MSEDSRDEVGSIFSPCYYLKQRNKKQTEMSGKEKQIVSALNFLSKSLCSGTFCIKAVLTVLSIKAPMPSKILRVA